MKRRTFLASLLLFFGVKPKRPSIIRASDAEVQNVVRSLSPCLRKPDAPPGTITTTYAIEPETGLKLRMDRQLVGAWAMNHQAGSRVDGWIVLEIRSDQVSCGLYDTVTVMIEDRLEGFTRTEWRSVGFSFPKVFGMKEWS